MTKMHNGSDNQQWKGDNIGYAGLHRRIRKIKENQCSILSLKIRKEKTQIISSKISLVIGIKNSNVIIYETNPSMICESFGTANQVFDDFYIKADEVIKNGTVIYYDSLRKQKIEAGKVFGFNSNGKNYTFKINANFEVSEFVECIKEGNERLYFMGSITSSNWNDADKNFFVNGRDTLEDYVNYGIDAVQVEVVLTDIWKGTIDSSPDWDVFEQRLKLIKKKSLKVSLRVWLCYPRMWNGFVSDTLYWGSGIAEVDEWGNTPEGAALVVPFTLADDGFRAKIVDRYSSILNKAFSILGSDLMWSAPVRSSSAEYADELDARYWYQVGGNWVANQYFPICSYNPKNLPKWREFVLLKYGTISAINTSWGTSYSTINDVQLPIVGSPFNNGLGHSNFEYLVVHAGNRGLDFYNFRHNKALVFANELRIATKSVWNDIIFCGEMGSFTGANVIRQATFNVNSFATVFDLLKGTTGVVDSGGNDNEGWDFVNINENLKVANELSWFDLDSHGVVSNNTPLYKSRLKEIAKTSIFLGHQFFLLLDNPHLKSKDNGVTFFDTWIPSLEAMKELKSEVGTTIYPRPPFTSQFTQTLRNALDGENNIRTNWLANGGSRTNRVKINFTI
jgi:hypothetical protein